MAENERGQEKTEEATTKRKQESREQGQVPRSKELSTLLSMLAAGAGLLYLGKGIIDDLIEVMRENLVLDRADIFNSSSMIGSLAEGTNSAIHAVLPLFVLMAVVGVIAPMALGGWAFSFKPMQIDLSKMDPIKGMKKVFSFKGLAELLKSLIKFLVVGTAGYLVLKYKMPEFMQLGHVSIEQGLAAMGEEMIWIFILISSALVLIAVADVPFQLWDFARTQKMTLQEVKDEHKQTEGSPEMKGRIRQSQRELARRRMMAEVPKADVVVTNPTHYAVALRYDQNKMAAPVVVALGADEIAGHIRRIASAHGVPILSAPPLARALYYNTDLEQEIPAGLYLAVAQVLAYVYQLRNYHRRGGAAPQFNPDVPIPDELKREARA
jgi:flagellar biosynthetic protein FlhB